MSTTSERWPQTGILFALIALATTAGVLPAAVVTVFTVAASADGEWWGAIETERGVVTGTV